MDWMMVSVIVPVYNTSLYLRKCIDSIISQTYKNLEIILVDDGSTDSSVQIIKEYMERDGRISLIEQENAGPSIARNRALDICTGDAIFFMDSDDYIDEECIEILVNQLDENTDAVIYPYIREYSSKSLFTPLFDEEEVIFSHEQMYHKILGRLVGPVYDGNKLLDVLKMERLNPCYCHLYKRDVVGKVRFVDTNEIFLEDGFFNIEVFNQSNNNVKYTSKCVYHYNKTNQTSFLHTFSTNSYKKKWNVYERIHNLIVKMGYDDLELNLANRIMLDRFLIILSIADSPITFALKLKKTRDVLKDERYMPWKEKADIRKVAIPYRVFYFLCDRKAVFPLCVMMKLASSIKGICYK